MKSKILLLILLINIISSKLYAQDCDSLIEWSTSFNNDSKMAETENKLMVACEGCKKNEIYYIALTNLAGFYAQQGYFDKAEPIAEKVIAISKQAFGENNEITVRSMRMLASFYLSHGNFEKATPLYELILEIRKKKMGLKYLDFAESLSDIALLYKEQRKFKLSEFHFQQALEIYNIHSNEKKQAFANTLNDLASLYELQSDFLKAEPLYIKALSIRKLEFGENNIQYAASLNNLARLYVQLGKYSLAEPMYLKGLDIIKYNYGDKHLFYSIILANLGDLYFEEGDIKAAEQKYVEAMGIQELTIGTKHINYAKSLNNLSNIYILKGEYKKAEPLYKEVIEIIKEIYGKNNTDFAIALNNQGRLYENIEEYSKAKSLYQQAENIFEKQPSKNNLEYAKLLNNIGVLFLKQKNYKEAILFGNKSLKMNKLLLGEFHSETAKSIYNLAISYSSNFEYENANLLLKNYFSIGQLNNQNMLAWLSSKQSEVYLKSNKYNFEALFSQIINYSASTLKDSLLNYTYFIKGALLQNTNRLSNAATLSVDAKVQENWTEYKDKKRYIAQLYQLPKDKQNELASTQDEADKLEKWLMQNVPEFKESVNNNNIKWKQVQAKLDDGEAAIEFVNFKYQNKHWTDTTIYAAFIVKKGIEQPIFINCFQEKELVALLNNKSDAEEINKLYNGSTAGARKSLYNLVWKPLDTALQGITTIYLSPSGLLHKVAFAAIGTPSNKRLSDLYELHFMNNTRAIAENKKAMTTPASIALLGGIDYDEQATNNATTKDAIVLTDKNINTLRNATFNNWSYLPGTNKEVVAINNLLQNQNKTTIYNGTNASEELIKEMGTGKQAVPAVLHFATHGYAMPEPKQVYKDRTNFILDKKEPLFYNSEDALTRSGLILAGANKIWTTGKPFANKEDGILTAREIMELNLGGCQLAVLSACETGLGTLEGSEGIYGLQRALKIAGVQNIIVSLWAVPDAETSEFMQLFYTNWLVKNMEMQKAFSTTQQSMSAKYDVQKWGAFVLMQ